MTVPPLPCCLSSAHLWGCWHPGSVPLPTSIALGKSNCAKGLHTGNGNASNRPGGPIREASARSDVVAGDDIVRWIGHRGTTNGRQDYHGHGTNIQSGSAVPESQEEAKTAEAEQPKGKSANRKRRPFEDRKVPKRAKFCGCVPCGQFITFVGPGASEV